MASGSSAQLKSTSRNKDFKVCTYLANKACPTPFAAQCLNSTVSIPDTLLAPLTLGQPQPHMARLAVRMTAVDRKAHVIRLKLAVTRQGQLPTPFFVLFKIRARRSEERIAALGAEKVWFVVRPFPKRGVVETDEPLFDDGSFAVVAARCKVLQINS